MISIKTAQITDLNSLQIIVDNAYKGTLHEGLGNLSNGILLNSGTYYFASIDGLAVACGGFSFEDPLTKTIENKIGHIRNFATHTDFRKQGFAKRIINHCIKEAIEKNLNYFYCYSSTEGEYFYKSCGFSELSRETINIKDKSIPIIKMGLSFGF